MRSSHNKDAARLCLAIFDEIKGLRKFSKNWYNPPPELFHNLSDGHEGIFNMNALPQCQKCASELTYDDGNMYVCPECAHEWAKDTSVENTEQKAVVRDANGNVLSDGDTVAVIKDLKVKGSPSGLKMGTRVKNIRLVEGDHNIDCKIDGIGAMKLKSEFVKKC